MRNKIKITRSQLKQIIQEALAHFKEHGGSESSGSHDFSDTPKRSISKRDTIRRDMSSSEYFTSESEDPEEDEDDA